MKYLAFLLLLSFPAQAALLTGSTTPYAAHTPAQPAAAADAGYDTLSFWDDFSTLSVDVNNTAADGFNWYMQQYKYGTYPTPTGYTLPASSASVKGSILTFYFTEAQKVPNYCLSSAGWNSERGFYGRTLDNTGFYIEARMAYNPALSTVGHDHFPAFWLMDQGVLQHNAEGGNYTGDVREDELDIIEAWPGNGTVTPIYVDWEYRNGVATASNTNTNLGVPTVDANYHTYGLLWVPMSRNSGTGLIKRYVDGVHIAGGDVSYTANGISSQAGSGALTGWLSGLDNTEHGLIMFIQAGPDWPVYVDYVQVWQP